MCIYICIYTHYICTTYTSSANTNPNAKKVGFRAVSVQLHKIFYMLYNVYIYIHTHISIGCRHAHIDLTQFYP